MLLCLDQYTCKLLRPSNGVRIYMCVCMYKYKICIYIYVYIAVSWGSVVNDLKTHPHCEDAFVKIRPMRNPCSVNCHASHACEAALALCWWPLCRESGFAMRLRLPGPYPGNVSPEAVFATPSSQCIFAYPTCLRPGVSAALGERGHEDHGHAYPSRTPDKVGGHKEGGGVLQGGELLRLGQSSLMAAFARSAVSEGARRSAGSEGARLLHRPLPSIPKARLQSTRNHCYLHSCLQALFWCGELTEVGLQLLKRHTDIGSSHQRAATPLIISH